VEWHFRGRKTIFEGGGGRSAKASEDIGGRKKNGVGFQTVKSRDRWGNKP